MVDRFKDTYRTESLRLEGFEYSSEAIYFITICTENRIHFFGSVTNNKMVLSKAGSIVAAEWMRTKELRPRTVLGEWVVMPNHFHALIYLKPKNTKCRDASNASQKQNEYQINTENQGDEPNNCKNKFGPQRNNIASIIGGFKSACTRKIRKKCTDEFSWQKGYFDHIVRNQNSLLKIEEYIRDNPRKWVNDRYYCES